MSSTREEHCLHTLSCYVFWVVLAAQSNSISNRNSIKKSSDEVISDIVTDYMSKTLALGDEDSEDNGGESIKSKAENFQKRKNGDVENNKSNKNIKKLNQSKVK